MFAIIICIIIICMIIKTATCVDMFVKGYDGELLLMGVVMDGIMFMLTVAIYAWI